MTHEPEYWNICYYADCCDEKDFLIMALRYYKAKSNVNQDYRSWLYKLGRDYNLLKMSYDEFLKVFQKTEYGLNVSYCRSYRLRYKWRDRTTKYVKNTSHKKKDKKAKQAWRIHKKIKRDKARRDPYPSYRKWDRGYAALKHRVWVKENLQKENWEAFGGFNELKQFWDWS